MANEVRPLELIQLCKLLDERFTGKIIPLGTDDISRQRNYYSKALAAYYLMREAGADIDGSVNASIDGGGDHGIDSVYIDATETIWLIQSKYIDSGKGEPSLGDVNKFESGVKDFLKQKFERFNDALNNKVPSIKNSLDSGVAKVKAILLYTGDALSDDRRHIMSDLEKAFKTPEDPAFLCFTNAGLDTCHRSQIKEVMPELVSTVIELENFGHIEEPYSCYYGSISVHQLKSLKEEFGTFLFDANIRQFQGDTIVNKDIAKTLKNEPEHFFYFNNGVTFLCNSFQAVGPRDDTRSMGKFRVNGLSVINGAQTVSCIADSEVTHGDAKEQAVDVDDQSKVMATIISLQNAPEKFGQHVTKYRNNQNSVSEIDFAALDENQQQWSNTLKQAEVNYRYKSGEFEQEDFNVGIAAKALACTVTGNGWHTLLVKAKKDPKKLFSRKIVDDHQVSYYKLLFKDSLQARTLWRTVQTLKQVQSILKADMRQVNGQEKEILSHCVLLVCHILFIKFESLEDDELTVSQEHEQRIDDLTRQITQEVLLEYDRHTWNKAPRAVFENPADINTLKGPVMAILAQEQGE